MRLGEANGLLGQASAAPAPAAAAAAAPAPGAPVAAAAAVAPRRPKPGESGQFLAAKADASGEKGGLRIVHGRQARRARERAGAARDGPRRGRRRRRRGAGVGLEHASARRP